MEYAALSSCRAYAWGALVREGGPAGKIFTHDGGSRDLAFLLARVPPHESLSVDEIARMLDMAPGVTESLLLVFLDGHREFGYFNSFEGTFTRRPYPVPGDRFTRTEVFQEIVPSPLTFRAIPLGKKKEDRW